MLIVTATAFNKATNLPVVLPITTGGEFARRLGFAVQIDGIETDGDRSLRSTPNYSTSLRAVGAKWTCCRRQSWRKCWPTWPRYSVGDTIGVMEDLRSKSYAKQITAIIPIVADPPNSAGQN